MNNITMDDIDQNRPPPKRTCLYCGKEFRLFEKTICTGGAGWTAFEYHPKCHSEKLAKAKKQFPTS